MAKQRQRDWRQPLLADKTFAFLGREFRPVEAAWKLAAAEGAAIADEIDPGVDYVVVPERARGAEVAALRKTVKQWNRKGASIALLTPAELAGVLPLASVDVIAMLQAGEPGVKRFKKLVSACDALRDSESPSPVHFDLAGSDLRGLTISSTNLTSANLDRVDLREATLRNCELSRLLGARLDGADLRNCQLQALKRCTLEGAKLNHIRFAPGAENKVIEDCTFDGASLTQASLSLRIFRKCSFRGALIRRARMELTDASGCDFTEATLDESNLHEATLARAKLVSASLRKAILSRADMRGADLSGADLRGAYLVGADLSRAVIDGADFHGANLFAANIEGVDLSRAKEIVSTPQPKGSVGPHTREFAEAASRASRALTTAEVRFPGGERVTLRVSVAQVRASALIELHAGKPTVLNTRGRQICLAAPVEEALMETARATGWGELAPETVAVQSDSDIDDDALKQMARSAWCEVFGRSPVPQADLKKHGREREKRIAKLREKLLKSLRTGIRGIDGVEKITHDNIHLIHRRMETIGAQIQALMSEVGPEGVVDLRGVNLRKTNLIGAYFARVNLEGADLSGAFGGEFGHVNLRNANLRGARVGGAAHADLSGADLRDAQLQDVCLLRARLDRADLAGANLCGADLTDIQAADANWEDAAFDAKTRFSPDFAIPPGLVWRGPGADPRETPPAARTRKPRRATDAAPSLKCLLTDKQLARLCADLERDPAFPDGIAAEDLRHPLYGPDFAYSLALEYCPNRFRGLGLSREEYAFNVWYRAERFAQLFDAAEDSRCDGNHDRSERLMPAISNDLFEKAWRRIEREVRKLVSAGGRD